MKKYIQGSQQTKWSWWPREKRTLLEDDMFTVYMQALVRSGYPDTPCITFGVTPKGKADAWQVTIWLTIDWAGHSNSYGKPGCDTLKYATVHYDCPRSKPGPIQGLCDVLLHAEDVRNEILDRRDEFNKAASEWLDEIVAQNQPEEK